MVISRKILSNLRHILRRGKSVLLIGPRQTGKTTLVMDECVPDIVYSFASIQVRQRYERDPALLELELSERLRDWKYDDVGMPVIFIDEVQKIPQVMDIAQHFIDGKAAQFILTGSSALKLKHGSQLNLLPGRVVLLHMPPLLFEECFDLKPTLEELLIYGSLPQVIINPVIEDRESDLYSYVSTYVEEEIRAEAKVRNIGSFARFLELAAGEAGMTVNFTRLSQTIGVSDTTIASYYKILEDCLIALRVDPLTKSQTKRRLIKAPKYLFFDLGIRRACANEGAHFSLSNAGYLFEHYVGTELIYQSRLRSPAIKVKYWRDSSGPEIDFILDISQRYIPIEVKWTEAPKPSDASHIKRFMQEYDGVECGYIVCRTPYRYEVTEGVFALPWQEIHCL